MKAKYPIIMGLSALLACSSSQFHIPKPLPINLSRSQFLTSTIYPIGYSTDSNVAFVAYDPYDDGMGQRAFVTFTVYDIKAQRIIEYVNDTTDYIDDSDDCIDYTAEINSGDSCLAVFKFWINNNKRILHALKKHRIQQTSFLIQPLSEQVINARYNNDGQLVMEKRSFDLDVGKLIFEWQLDTCANNEFEYTSALSYHTDTRNDTLWSNRSDCWDFATASAFGVVYIGKIFPPLDKQSTILLLGGQSRGWEGPPNPVTFDWYLIHH